MKLLIMIILMMAMMTMPSAMAEQEMIVSRSLTGTNYEMTITDSYYQIGDNGDVEMIVKMYLDPCYPFEAGVGMNNDGTIFFSVDDLVEYHLIKIISISLELPSCVVTETPSCEWRLSFEGKTIDEKIVFFSEQEREHIFLFPRFELLGKEKITLFLDENLMVVTSENASWKVLVFPDEEKFIVYQR